MDQTTLFLTVSVSTNASSAVQSNNESKQPTTVTPLSQTGDIPIEGDTPVGRVEDSQTKLSSALDSAEEAMDTMKTWKVAVGVIDVVKQVMDHVGPIVKVCLRSNFADPSLS